MTVPTSPFVRRPATLASLGALCLAAALPSAVRASVPSASAAGERSAAAASAFAAGRFAESESLYAVIVRAKPRDTLSRLRLGTLLLYRNRLEEARGHLQIAADAWPDSISPRRLLAECHYRGDDYAAAAKLARAIGQEARARKLESFGTNRPYRIEGGRVEIPFTQAEPLPLIEVSVNGRAPALFLIDTGGAEVVLDPAFADSCGARTFGADSGVFAGDRRAAYQHGRIDRLGLGGLTLHDLPVQMLPTRPWTAAFGRRVDGVIGTLLLQRFRATLDYPARRLVLEPRGVAPSPPGAASAGTRSVPIWLAGDHLILAHGSLGSGPQSLLLVDTGLAGMAFTAPRSTLREAGVSLDDSAAAEGIGGGGRVRVTPFSIDLLRLGEVEGRGLMGVYGAFPASLEYGQGFRIGGLISHSFFRPWRLTLDFDMMRLVMAPPD